MTSKRIFVTGMGMVSALGNDGSATLQALYQRKSGIHTLSLFSAPQILPVGEAPLESRSAEAFVPRTHRLALAAARQALEGRAEPPESVIIGVTTGGMPLTEDKLRRHVADPEAYRFHATWSVTGYVARQVGCRGPAWTVSTACSSGAVALALALELLRSGRVRRILAGGVDALCRLTYYGFHALQLLDSQGARPFDIKRKGLNLAEGSALLLLTAAEHPPEGALAELAGAGLSCDAWHPATPHPEGLGALKAMERALRDAAVSPPEVNHVSLHGTGTPDNDRAEARALGALFGNKVPAVASVKGALGHSLAAAGALEAAISVAALRSGRIPPTIGFETPDPDLKIRPVSVPVEAEIDTVLSNSFGFGGNNAALVFRRCGLPALQRDEHKSACFSVLGEACLTGAGDLAATLAALDGGMSCQGLLDATVLSRNLDNRSIRRLKRLPRMALTLAKTACPVRIPGERPSSIFFSTGWGPLSETHDFLNRLFESGDRFSSPSDFVGSVYNAPAGQVGMEFGATGPNVTLTGSETGFEQALAAAGLLAQEGEESLLVLGADEYHPAWTPLFDRSAVMGIPSDCGGALWLKRGDASSGLRIKPLFQGSGERNDAVMEDLFASLNVTSGLSERIAAVMAGLPAACEEGAKRLAKFRKLTGFEGPVLDYRQWIGQSPSASAVAVVLGVSFVRRGKIPAAFNGGAADSLNGRGILVIGLGDEVSAVEIMP